jgi:predicted MFS family arabinose efflux permease
MTDTVRSADTRSVSMPPWRLGLAGVAMIAVTFGLARYGYGLFAPQLRIEFGLSVGVVGLIGSATYLGYLAALVAVGVWGSRLGPRLLVSIGGGCATTGMAAVALAHDTVVLVAGLIMAGTSTGWAWAPFSDAVHRMVAPSRRDTVMGLIPSGTAFGVAVAGSLALLFAGDQWRWAWWVFTAIALAVTVYNAVTLVGKPDGPARRVARPALRWLVRPDTASMYLTAISYGLVGAVYWTFAVTAVSGGASAATTTAALFWSAMGLAGTAGLAAGVVLDRCGLRFSHIGVFVAMAAAVALLAWWPHAVFAVVASALLYGPAFMAGSSVLAVWSYRLFPGHPSTGFSVTLLAVGAGTILGPAALGLVADHSGLAAAFGITAVVSLLTVALAPRHRHG